MQIAHQTIFEEGDGDDSDIEGVEIDLHTAAMRLAETSKRNDFELALDAAESGAIPGSPDGWKPPCATPDFKLYKPKNGAPILEDLENPGGWSEYTYLLKSLNQ